MNAADFRRLALAMTNASEGAHMGHADFRVDGRIFATLHPGDQIGMVKLTPAQQYDLVSAGSNAFAPENGAWGRQCCTRVSLDLVDEDTLGEALTLAWQNTVRKPAGAKRKRKT